MGYATPADVVVSDTWTGHANRNPPSAEPGTDYATAYGTDLRMAGDGFVSIVDQSPEGGEGRRCSIDLDDGRRVSYLHLSAVFAFVGQRVTRGQTGLLWSGASGNGDEWHYGPHVHVSLWERPGMSYRDTIDFELYAGEPTPEPNRPEGEAVMYIRATSSGQYAVSGYTYTNDIGGHWRGVSNLEGDGYIGPLSGTQLPYAEFSGLDIDLLFALNGVWEQEVLDGHVTWSSGKNLIGLGSLTGRLRYPGAAGTPGEWHDPYNVPVPSSGAHALVAPAWVAGFFLGLIGLVQVVRFIVDLII